MLRNSVSGCVQHGVVNSIANLGKHVGQLSECRTSSLPEQTWNILHQEHSRSNVSNDSSELQDKIVAIVHIFTDPLDREALAGWAPRDQVDRILKAALC
jgi:hypothetical protein